jgi:hypothetical protein
MDVAEGDLQFFFKTLKMRGFDVDGAPRPMKVGTIASLWHYDFWVRRAPK